MSLPAGRRSLADRSLVQLTLVRFREFLREPEAVFWTFVFPILLAAGLGIAFRLRPPERTKVAVVRGAAVADTVARRLAASPSLAVQTMDSAAAAHALVTGQVALVVTATGDTTVRYWFDETRPEGAQARLLVDDVLQRGAGRRDPVRVTEQHVRERGQRYIDFLIPGLIGMNLMGSGIWGLGFAIVDARRKKLLKRLVATPMSRGEYLLSFLLSRLIFLVAEVGVLLGFGVVVFGVPTRGSFGALAIICLLGALAFGGLGLLLAARAQTIEGVSGLMNLVMLPMWIFSGVFFSSENFPRAIQPFIQALPLTAVNDALRGNMLQGQGLVALGGELAIIGAWLVATFVIALRTFRWR